MRLIVAALEPRYHPLKSSLKLGNIVPLCLLILIAKYALVLVELRDRPKFYATSRMSAKLEQRPYSPSLCWAARLSQEGSSA